LLAETNLLIGRADQACLLLESFLQVTQFAPPQAEALNAHVRLAWARGALGQMALAEETVATVLASAKPLVRVDALRVQGLLATIRKRWDAGAAALDGALESTRAMPYPYAEAKTLWAYGRLEVARGDSAAARDRFAQALAICDQLGEGIYRQQIERDLASLEAFRGSAVPQ
jgi:hypothetical protein